VKNHSAGRISGDTRHGGSLANGGRAVNN
jgi:hypothetical protein